MLVCIIDGVSCYVYPTDTVVKKQEKRFKRLLREKLYWGSATKGWYDRDKAASVLYAELRNPLVHELALDKPAKARPAAYYESAIGKWGFVAVQDISVIDSMTAWNEDWPTLGIEAHNGGERLKLSCAALYWTVKRMINDLAADPAIIAAAPSRNRASVVGPSLLERICRLIRNS